MKEKGQDVRGMPLAFELVTPIVTLSSLFEPSLLPHLFFLSPHSPPHVLESRVLGQGTMSSGWSEPFAGHHKGGGGSYCGLPNSTNVCGARRSIAEWDSLSLGCCGEVLVPDPVLLAFPTAVALTRCQVAWTTVALQVDCKDWTQWHPVNICRGPGSCEDREKAFWLHFHVEKETFQGCCLS